MLNILFLSIQIFFLNWSQQMHSLMDRNSHAQDLKYNKSFIFGFELYLFT